MLKEGTKVRVTLAGIRAYCQCDLAHIHCENLGPELKYIDAMLEYVEKNTVFTVAEKVGILGEFYGENETGTLIYLNDILVQPVEEGE